tara:strand:+ start:220 stop:987 length:768 start_codon:yes stop_codon:yes gene_type:complete
MGQKKDPVRFAEKRMPEWEADVRIAQEALAKDSNLSEVEKFMNFPVFASRQAMTRVLARYELFKMVLDIPGSIFECGVLFGGGVFSFAHFSTIFEPVNAQRTIVGFDTFKGLPELHENDKSKMQSSKMHKNAMSTDSYDELLNVIKVFDMNRALNHLPKIELVKGDITKTLPRYLKDNTHTLVSLLYLDIDLYIGTKAAIENCLPRMPKGAIIAFDEFACERWPGETVALLDSVGVSGKELRRFPFDSYLSYLVV